MYGIENYFGFIIAGVLLNLTPGADTMYILTRSITQGRRAGIYSVLGVSTGVLIHTTFAAFGLSIVLAKSTFAFNMIKYIGLAYLVYIGITMVIERNNLFDNKIQKIDTMNLYKIYRQGLLTNILNPKVAIFFLSLLPQFINLHYSNGAIPWGIKKIRRYGSHERYVKDRILIVLDEIFNYFKFESKTFYLIV